MQTNLAETPAEKFQQIVELNTTEQLVAQMDYISKRLIEYLAIGDINTSLFWATCICILEDAINIHQL